MQHKDESLCAEAPLFYLVGAWPRANGLSALSLPMKLLSVRDGMSLEPCDGSLKAVCRAD